MLPFLIELQEKILIYIQDRFPQYTVKKCSSSIYIYIQDGLQKDLNITDRIPYVDMYMQDRPRSPGFRINWSANLCSPFSTKGLKYTPWDDRLLEKNGLEKIVRRRIERYKIALDKRRAYQEDQVRLQKEKEAKELARVESIKDYLRANAIDFKQEGHRICISSTPSVSVHDIGEAQLEISIFGSCRAVRKENFKDFLISAQVVSDLSFQ
jgi:hypothetical protein